VIEALHTGIINSHAPPKKGTPGISMSYLEHSLHRHLLLEQALGKVDLVRNGATIDLDLHQVRLLLAPGHLLDLQRDQSGR